MRSRSVLISGAGIAGPTLAYWLLKGGFMPTLVERAPAPRTGGYIVDFWGVGYDVAERMGILPAVLADGYRISEVRFVDRRGRTSGGFDASVFDAASGGRFTSLPRGDLARHLFDAVAGSVETIFSDSITALYQDDEGVAVAFERSTARRFDLVIGADGLHSNVRHLAVTADSRVERYLGYYTAAFSVVGYRHRDEHAYVSYSVPGRQVARYALRGGRSAFFFIFASAEPIAVAHHDQAAQRRVLRETFAGAGWECDEILEAMARADDLYFDAVAQTRLDSWSRGRVALVGDAAYCPSLLAGEGSAFGMAGAYVLSRALAASPDDHLTAFARYEQQFKPFVSAKQDSAARFGAWFAPRTRLELWMRNVATRLFSVPVLGRRLVSRSFGDAFRLPD